MKESAMHRFPIPVVALGPGSRREDEDLQYLPMPHDMRTYRTPILPEAETVRDLQPARAVLRQALAALRAPLAGPSPTRIELDGLDSANLGLIDQLLGEGEVSARIDATGGSLRIQESVFAGVWRVRMFDDAEHCLADRIEVGALPDGVVQTAPGSPGLPGAMGNVTGAAPADAGVTNAPALLAEIAEHLRLGTPHHIINLSLLPFSPEDGAWLDRALGRGPVALLSRGYGNCRITATGIARVWWVQYFNSQDALILNTLEIIDAPEVARAAREDLDDSADRLAEVLEWIG